MGLPKSLHGRKTIQNTRIPRNEEVFLLINDFTTDKRAEPSRVVANEILSYSIEQGIVSVETYQNDTFDKNDYKSGTVTVQIYLRQLGFLRVNRKCKHYHV